MTRDEYAAMSGDPLVGRLLLPCGPDYGCDFDGCLGWAGMRDDSDDFELRHWSAEEIAEAREWSTRHGYLPAPTLVPDRAERFGRSSHPAAQ